MPIHSRALSLLFISTIAALSFTLSAYSAAASLSVENFAQLPDADGLTLTPDGQKVAALVRVDAKDQKGIAVQVTNLNTQKKKFHLFTDNSKYFISRVQWKDSNTLLVHTFYPSRRDTWTGWGQVRGDTRETRLLIINTESGDVTRPFKHTFLDDFRVLPVSQDQIVDLLPDDPDHLLMAMPGFSGGPYNVVYKVNIRNQRVTAVQNSEPSIMGWGTDLQHRVRVGLRFNDGVVSSQIYDLNTKQWRELWPYTPFSKAQTSVIGFAKNPDIVYLRAAYKDRLAIFKTNLTDPKLEKTLVYADPTYDVMGSLIYDPNTADVIGVNSASHQGSVYFSDKLSALQNSINKLMPDTQNFIYDLTDDKNRYLLYTTGAKESGTYYLGQRNPAKLTALEYRYRSLPPEVLSSTRDYHYSARDGLSIEAWLTLPKGKKAKKLPTILFPHGGPQARDSAAFDYWAQFFANQGYAVLQMNFRGSVGEGFSHRNAGLKKWGQEMQDDIQDGALQLIKDGITDPDKICLAGASYGGYAALMGTVKTPDFYQCAISFAGVSDVFEWVRGNRDFRSAHNIVDEQIGELGEQLKDVSPVNHAEKIKVPILLIHGDSDRQVPPEHSERMYDALQALDKPVDYIVLENEGHFLANEDSRVTTFNTISRFLNKHLPINAQ
ncbi:S9 family peptidase [uncultured Gilvimarinus sp.]|uniref:alpha/beta hydrolase family protein n=1 Tax=uncultured Gilvimarinus sp. TaxID=1689143 RepID=UPI0030DBCA78